MPIVVTNPTNGTAMSWASMTTQFATMRTWLNAVPNTDITDGQIQTEHLVRPVVAGYPIDGMASDFREYRWRTSGLTGQNLYHRFTWPVPERLMIAPSAADRQLNIFTQAEWNLPIGAPLYGVGTNVRIWFSCVTLARMDPALFTGGGALTPPIHIGTFQIRTQVEGQESAVIEHSRCKVWCNQWDGGSDRSANSGTLMNRSQLFAQETAATLDWVYVTFRRERDDVDQLDLQRISFHVEVF